MEFLIILLWEQMIELKMKKKIGVNNIYHFTYMKKNIFLLSGSEKSLRDFKKV